MCACRAACSDDIKHACMQVSVQCKDATLQESACEVQCIVVTVCTEPATCSAEMNVVDYSVSMQYY